MNSEFSRCLSLLRKELGMSQRAVAKELGISQALLSHYENGVREPGLVFVVKACDFYHVSTDFLLGRTLSRDGTTIATEEVYDYSTEKDNVLQGSVMATLNKKLIVNSVAVLYDLLGKLGNKDAIRASSDYLSTAIYRVYRHLYRGSGMENEDFFSVSSLAFTAGIADSDMSCAESELVESLAHHAKEKKPFPAMNNESLACSYPGLYQSLLQVIHSTGQRINAIAEARKGQK